MLLQAHTESYILNMTNVSIGSQHVHSHDELIHSQRDHRQYYESACAKA